MLRVGVVGTGNMGRNHVRVLAGMHEAELVGACDQNRATAEQNVGRYRVPLFDSHEEFFDTIKPDAVVIATPTATHRDVAIAALKRGIHVLVEKPIALSVAEAEEMIALAEEKGLVLQIGYIERFNPAVLELRRRIAGGELGKIFMIHARRQSAFPGQILDVGVAHDIATHELDMMRYLSGSEVVNLRAEVGQVLRKSIHEDIVFGLLRFENGVLGVLDVNWVTPTRVRKLTITGEKGMFEVDYLTQDLYFYQNRAALLEAFDANWLSGYEFTVDEGHMTRFQIRRREPLLVELVSFVNAIERGERPLVDGRDGLATLKLSLAILEQRH